MRRVDADGVPGWRLHADENAGFCAMAVKHVRLQLADQPSQMQPGSDIRNRWLAANGQTMHPEFEPRLDLRQGFPGAFSAGERIGDDPDVMAAVDLAIGEIKDMAED